MPPTVTKYKICRTLLRKRLRLDFNCPVCNSDLFSEQAGNETCPNCQLKFVLDPKLLKAFLAQERDAAELAERKLAAKQQRKKQQLEAREAEMRAAKDQQETAKEKEQAWKFELEAAKAEYRRAVNSVILSSTPTLQGFRIKRYMMIDGVEYVVGTGFISEAVTEFGDFFGARSTMFEGKLRAGRLKAMQLMQILAHKQGANAVVGIDIDYTEYSNNRTAIIVNGTLVEVERED